jgi:hypothetical protein
MQGSSAINVTSVLDHKFLVVRVIILFIFISNWRVIDTQTMYLPQLSKVDLDFGDLGAWVVPIKLALTKALELYARGDTSMRGCRARMGGRYAPSWEGRVEHTPRRIPRSFHG